jgi:hypothetical protein
VRLLLLSVSGNPGCTVVLLLVAIRARCIHTWIHTWNKDIRELLCALFSGICLGHAGPVEDEQHGNNMIDACAAVAQT